MVKMADIAEIGGMAKMGVKGKKSKKMDVSHRKTMLAWIIYPFKQINVRKIKQNIKMS